ncbi:hypothetical protein A9K55_005279 [Cordyceps militaris]|uniref:Uncharacterized protein n=1 Tax=Cordyceps militaris TaxID=73501 RepID=A0A2H4SP87_CORMI|nr:hypothetical protein A9K55_005279 [Cordyceps militaris]
MKFNTALTALTAALSATLAIGGPVVTNSTSIMTTAPTTTSGLTTTGLTTTGPTTKKPKTKKPKTKKTKPLFSWTSLPIRTLKGGKYDCGFPMEKMKPWRPIPGEDVCQWCLDWACVSSDRTPKQWPGHVMYKCGSFCVVERGGSLTAPLPPRTTWPSDDLRNMYSKWEKKQNASIAKAASLSSLKSASLALATNSSTLIQASSSSSFPSLTSSQFTATSTRCKSSQTGVYSPPKA